MVVRICLPRVDHAQQRHFDATEETVAQVLVSRIQPGETANGNPLHVRNGHHELHTPEFPIGLNLLEVMAESVLEGDHEGQSEGTHHEHDALGHGSNMQVVPPASAHAIIGQPEEQCWNTRHQDAFDRDLRRRQDNQSHDPGPHPHEAEVPKDGHDTEEQLCRVLGGLGSLLGDGRPHDQWLCGGAPELGREVSPDGLRMLLHRWLHVQDEEFQDGPKCPRLPDVGTAKGGHGHIEAPLVRVHLQHAHAQGAQEAVVGR
mmetsp:Transcript_24339/g.63966  ORF Transcript_24339/g.63966 Transcript_24339/m.63966 type:complete len:259 (-) Transcript_24339:389-1165(-)